MTPCKKGGFVMPSPIPALRTSGVIASELGEPLHRVLYVLRTRPYITPSALAGRLRLYDRAAVVMIRHALNGIDARKAVRHG
jgi:hypothetical protein